MFNVFDTIIVSIILLLFPILCYLMYLVVNKDVNSKRKELVLKFSLVSIFYLIYKFNICFKLNILMLMIPIILAYKNNYKLLYILLNFIMIITNINNTAVYFYIINLILMLILNKNKDFTKSIIITIITTIIFIYSYDNKFYNYLYIVVFVSIINLVYYTMIKGEEIVDFHTEYNNLKREYEVRKSLFKITHEIKNPLAVIKAYIDMFDYDDKDKIKRYIPIISREVDKLLNLLQDFLLINKDNINKDIMDINLLIEDVIECMSINNIKIDVDNQYDEILTYGDYNRLNQVLTNLIKNSIEANCSKIKIKVNISDNIISIEVIDNGSGISSSIKEDIYKPFYTTKKNGTGLGVSLSKEIIEAHNGTLSYISDKYTTAKITLHLLDI